MFKKLLFLCLLFTSAIVCAQDVQIPPSHQVILSWTPPSNLATGCLAPCVVTYNILRSTISGQEGFYARVDGNITTYTDRNAAASTTGPITYFYQIRTQFTSQGFALQSNSVTPEVSAPFVQSVPPSFPPEIAARPQPPTGLAATPVP